MHQLDIFSRETQEFLIKTGKPVLLIGEKGVGKTSVLRSMSANFDMTMHELNAATLDPFVHIVGIPVTNDGKVEMNPPDELFNAQILFIDELNRADRPTRNALFEIICDKSVNGRKLPNLQIVVAAMNPPDSVYQVDELDDAMDDRFLYRFNVERDISFAKKLVSADDAELMQKWYSSIENPPSPRRLTWAVESCFEDGKIKHPSALLNALPDAKYNTSSLIKMLETGSAGLTNTFMSDRLLSVEENAVASTMIYSAIKWAQDNEMQGSPARTQILDLAKKFIDDNGSTWLMNPSFNARSMESMHSTFNDSKALQDLSEMIPGNIPLISCSEHIIAIGDQWLKHMTSVL